MPKIGSRETGATHNTVSDAVERTASAAGAADPSVYAPIGDYKRAQMVETAERTLAELKKTVDETRDRTGRIRKAKLVAAVLALRWQGFTPKQSAEILGCSQQAVVGALTIARKDSTISEQIDRIEKLGIPLAVDNALRGVMNGDKEYSLRMLDGRGVFRTHKSVEADIRVTKLEMSIRVELADGVPSGDAAQIRPGSIVGRPAIDVTPAPPPLALPPATSIGVPITSESK